jgi:hypothetical protein
VKRATLWAVPIHYRPVAQGDVAYLPEEYEDFNTLVMNSRSGVTLTDGLKGGDPNVRAMVRDEFDIDVWNGTEATRRVAEIGLLTIREKLGVWDRSDVCFNSPNTNPRKLRGTGTGQIGSGGPIGRLDTSGVKARLFPEGQGGSVRGRGATSHAFGTPPQFRTYTDTRTEGSQGRYSDR